MEREKDKVTKEEWEFLSTEKGINWVRNHCEIGEDHDN